MIQTEKKNPKTNKQQTKPLNLQNNYNKQKKSPPKKPQRKCLPIPENDLPFTENEIFLGEFLFATVTDQLTFKPAA